MASSKSYDFVIPRERIAQRPRAFGNQKLLVYHKTTKSIEHTTFEALPELLKPGDLLVLNDTRVVPAQVRLATPHGACTSLLFLDPLREVYENMDIILSSRVPLGTELQLPGGLVFTVEKLVGGDPEVHQGSLKGLNEPLHVFLARIGEMPLPPYVERVPDKEDEASYQTSVATTPGAIAAPTAGLHFYPKLLERLQAAGIEHTCVTLHVGYGTFRSFSSEFVEQHRMDRERYHVSVGTSMKIHQALKENRRVIAVGTTATRVLETIGGTFKNAEALKEPLVGESGIFIYPPYEFKVLSGLFTNFHYPKTSVLTLTAAFCGSREALLDVIYKEAMEKDYLWYSYGDGMLVL
ncbi:S-adenosylmethionine/tRNA-ribosyltransferase-isomerase [Thraustotheca clavata]|uniref:S-adenosylmethionine/tRNA-ribosyltransferase-isomerase n=1 Tax=Thraustotheca clavata TaxID=74557 RepID=A0A1V9Y8W0_9STRA|nr:S-adenosylmethionine/tRNA-ribosyltransferase-isomerase [Thraustotheca clavata]